MRAVGQPNAPTQLDKKSFAVFSDEERRLMRSVISKWSGLHGGAYRCRCETATKALRDQHIRGGKLSRARRNELVELSRDDEILLFNIERMREMTDASYA